IWERFPLLQSAISRDIDRRSTGRRRRIVSIAGVSLVESVQGFLCTLEVGLETHLEGEVAERYGSHHHQARPHRVLPCSPSPPHLCLSLSHNSHTVE
ncbi:unnamed protein product, partial [Musa acuminata subsp. malaccensis]